MESHWKAVYFLGLLGLAFLFPFAGDSAPKLACTLLLGDIRVDGDIVTPRKTEEATLEGSIVFELPGPAGPGWRLSQFNLIVPRGISTPKGNSGVIGLSLLDAPVKAEYDERSGKIRAEFMMVLHYPLIDEVKGFREVSEKGCTVFHSYTERMRGVLEGRIRGDLRRGKEVHLEGKVSLFLANSVLGQVRAMEIWLRKIALFCGAQRVDIIKIQPVFVRNGSSTSGRSFSELMARAQEMWGRCGGVRCVYFQVLPPRYINNTAYWVIDSKSEGWRFSRTVNVPDAVEVFVAAEFSRDLALHTGGGWCQSCGTASAKIVTNDLQLDVPCDWCRECGDVNYFHLAHELGHALGLCHPGDDECPSWMSKGSRNSVMEPSGFCADNPDRQSARNCRMTVNPLLHAAILVGKVPCPDTPNIRD